MLFYNFCSLYKRKKISFLEEINHFILNFFVKPRGSTDDVFQLFYKDKSVATQGL